MTEQDEDDVKSFQKLFTKSHYKKLEEAKYEEPVPEAALVIEEASDDDILKLEIRASNGYKVLEAERITDTEDMIDAFKAEDLDEDDLESNAVMEEIGKEDSDRYMLSVSEIGYSLYDDSNFPVITHSAAPMIHSREDLVNSNMEDKPVPDNVKHALYLLDLMHMHAEQGNMVRSKAFEKVYEKEILPEINIRDKHLINTTWKNYSSEDPLSEIEDFFKWCISHVDAGKVLDYCLIADDLEKKTREEMEESQDE